MRMTLAVTIVGALFLLFLALTFTVFIPQFTPAHTVPSEGLEPYSELELKGKTIYQREGCWYCHTMQVRGIPGTPLEADSDLGPVSNPGDYAFDSPPLLGTERTGPDLFNEAGKRPDDWHMRHHKNPRTEEPASIMPRFDYLSDDEINALIAFMQRQRGGAALEAPVEKKLF